MIRFGKGEKKRDHKEPGWRRMPESVVTKAARKRELSQWFSVPLGVSASPQPKHRHEAVLVLRAHTLSRSAEDAPGGSECPDDANDGKNETWELIYCHLKADVNGGLSRLPRTATLTHFLSPVEDLCPSELEKEDEKRSLKKFVLSGTCLPVDVQSENAERRSPCHQRCHPVRRPRRATRRLWPTIRQHL
ncbi:hypothetical protein HPB50_029175 [Hyalomma asiaticum]|nr:hypothetical protein HPB50_029175 [Hyalomma asiaticum]